MHRHSPAVGGPEAASTSLSSKTESSCWHLWEFSGTELQCHELFGIKIPRVTPRWCWKSLFASISTPRPIAVGIRRYYKGRRTRGADDSKERTYRRTSAGQRGTYDQRRGATGRGQTVSRFYGAVYWTAGVRMPDIEGCIKYEKQQHPCAIPRCTSVLPPDLRDFKRRRSTSIRTTVSLPLRCTARP